jgi:acetate kinase
MNVLAVNSGSSSLKFKLVEFDNSVDAAAHRHPSIRYEGSVEAIEAAAKLLLSCDENTVAQSIGNVSTHAEAVQRLMQMLEQSSKLEGPYYRATWIQQCRGYAVGG